MKVLALHILLSLFILFQEVKEALYCQCQVKVVLKREMYVSKNAQATTNLYMIIQI